MGKQGRIVSVSVPVPEDVARRWEALSDEEKERLGMLLETLVSSRASASEAFSDYFRRLDAETEANGLTEDIVAEELAAWNAENRR